MVQPWTPLMACTIVPKPICIFIFHKPKFILGLAQKIWLLYCGKLGVRGTPFLVGSNSNFKIRNWPLNWGCSTTLMYSYGICNFRRAWNRTQETPYICKDPRFCKKWYIWGHSGVPFLGTSILFCVCAWGIIPWKVRNSPKNVGMVQFGSFCSRLTESSYIWTFFYVYHFRCQNRFIPLWCVWFFPPQDSYI
jgi:hypothetical protein